MAQEQPWVGFRVAEQAYGLPVAAMRDPVSAGHDGVVEIVRAPNGAAGELSAGCAQITPVPQAPEHIAGVTNLRGRIIPVIDLRKKLGMRDSELGTRGSASEFRVPNPEPRARVLVVIVEGKLIGMLVDEAGEVLKIAPSEIEPAPKVFGEDDESYVSGIAKLSGRLMVLLDLHKLLDRGAVQSPAANPKSLVPNPESRVPTS